MMMRCLAPAIVLLAWGTADLAHAGSTTSRSATRPAGTSLLPADAVRAFRLNGKPGEAALEVVDVAGREFGQAMRVRTVRRPAQVWNVQLNATNAAAVAKGDILLAVFWIRGIVPKDSQAHTVFIFEVSRPPNTKTVEFPVSAGADWRQVFVPFHADQDFPAGGANLNFQLGFEPQTVEIGGVSVVDLGPNARLADLPRTVYDGHAPDAPWRQAAAERIEKVRKADLAVTVVDAQGRPVPGADVTAKLTRHAFAFGSAVQAKLLTDQTDDARKYRDFVEKHFNRVVFANDLKWAVWGWENAANRKRTFQALEWLDGRSIQVRGHCLVWPGWRNMMPDVEGLKADPAALRKRIAGHVTDEVAALKGRLVEWDVINEPYTNHDVMDVLGNDVMVEWFKAARAADPRVKLFINDYSILAGAGLDLAHQDHYEKTIRFLIDQGAPLDGIGMQGHFGRQLTPPTRMLAILDRFAALGKEIEVTEFDVDTTDEPLLADFTRDFYTTVFSHPAVKGILTWGFWEGAHWRPNAAMVRKDWSLKPNSQVWMDLVERQWSTDERLRTDAAGRCRLRGFLGEYELTASLDGRQKAQKASLDPSGQSVKIVLPD